MGDVQLCERLFAVGVGDVLLQAVAEHVGEIARRPGRTVAVDLADGGEIPLGSGHAEDHVVVTASAPPFPAVLGFSPG